MTLKIHKNDLIMIKSQLSLNEQEFSQLISEFGNSYLIYNNNEENKQQSKDSLRKRGRKKGSKNKVKIDSQIIMKSDSETSNSRKRGPPKKLTQQQINQLTAIQLVCYRYTKFACQQFLRNEVYYNLLRAAKPFILKLDKTNIKMIEQVLNKMLELGLKLRNNQFGLV
ncbi:UNKNOWN [Stylonychia lemnae]|uniref:Uncharacterized protein n=1 Tax=Stylonychia lemnae TaxID=5949 RepID=A0A078B4N8_STYLE|nr:UNKNOWN [Stylonychia lemnae]|eukprot:CDW88192.1 UNKNOWN [Stylonychia lemnae]